ncbi:early nodulin-75-like [Aedes aegypti]|uniref:Uncharacterized protein n=1 Tax=Aedes aegypti TaxID=7159 RepID=A0A6I8TRW2_AEDAE|nr:early nodulin-75-like [Aedes aegypti]
MSHLPHNPHEGPISSTVFPPDMNPNYPHQPIGTHYPPGGVHPPGHYPPPHLMPPPLDNPNYPGGYPPGHYPPGHYPPGHYPPVEGYPPHYPVPHEQAVGYGAAGQRKEPEKK